MGCDIHMIVQKRDDAGKWIEIDGNFAGDYEASTVPFDWRSYGLFAFLAGVRNYAAITPISEPRGLPADFVDPDLDPRGWLEDDYRDVGDHSRTWLSVQELLDYDYDQVIEDRRCTRRLGSGIISGAETCEPGQGDFQKLREYLGDDFFRDLEELKRIGAERLVFGFDS